MRLHILNLFVSEMFFNVSFTFTLHQYTIEKMSLIISLALMQVVVDRVLVLFHLNKQLGSITFCYQVTRTTLNNYLVPSWKTQHKLVFGVLGGKSRVLCVLLHVTSPAPISTLCTLLLFPFIPIRSLDFQQNHTAQTRHVCRGLGQNSEMSIALPLFMLLQTERYRSVVATLYH